MCSSDLPRLAAPARVIRAAPLAAVPMPDPNAPRPEPSAAPTAAALQVFCAGVSDTLAEQAIRSRRLAVQLCDAVEEADAVLAVRQQLGRDPQVRRSAQAAAVPILVIKADTLPQIQRGLERLLQRRGGDDPAAEPGSAAASGSGDDELAALEECRLAVEQLVLPQGRPVELLPRSPRVRQLQAELAAHYQVATAEFGSGSQQRLRIFPR